MRSNDDTMPAVGPHSDLQQHVVQVANLRRVWCEPENPIWQARSGAEPVYFLGISSSYSAERRQKV